METKEKKESGVFWLMSDVSLKQDTEIYQYLRLDYLLSLLDSKMYYVKRKHYFSDKREKDYPNRMKFVVTPVGTPLQPNDNCQKEMTAKTAKFKEFSFLPTSCWTHYSKENILMWDRYTTQMGVRIKSSIDNFVSSFVDNKYYLWCGKMSYERHQQTNSFEESLWIKEPAYYDEREIRFYFSSKFEDISLDDCKSDHIMLKIKPDYMINEIVLSPHINKTAAKVIQKFIEDTYKITTKISDIELNN